MKYFIFELSDGTQETITAERYFEAVSKLHEKVKETGVFINNYTVKEILKKVEGHK